MTPPITNFDTPTHNTPRGRPPGDIWERFWSKVDQSGGPDACWPWTSVVPANGYGRFKAGGHNGKVVGAHRLAYYFAYGPTEAYLDHTCHSSSRDCPGGSACLHRRCCNPAHLEPVSHAENMARGVKKYLSRPGNGGGMVPIGAFVHKDLVAIIETYARQQGVNRSEAVRRGLGKAFKWPAP